MYTAQDILDSTVNTLSKELILEALDEAIKNTVVELVKDLQEISVILVSDTKSLISDVKEISNEKHLAHKTRKIMKTILQTSKVVMDFVHDIDVVIKSLTSQFDASI